MKEEHHVYLEWFLDGRAGGPPGYLANLLYGYNQIGYIGAPSIIFDTYQGKKPSNEKKKTSIIKRAMKSIFSCFPMGQAFYAEKISKYQYNNYNTLKSWLSNPDEIMPDQGVIARIDWKKTRSIHVHTVPDVIKIKNYLRKNFIGDIKVILTAHTPEPYAKEQYNIYLADGQSEKRAKELMNLWEAIEKRGYEMADIIIYPSKEAMEPHLNQVEGLREIMRNKDIRFMPTGCKQLIAKMDKNTAKEKYGVKDKFVVGFIGRHNKVKGYDLLQEAAQKIFGINDDIVFLIGGGAQGSFELLKDSRWIEAGWVNPAEMLAAVDVFVLPNRETYYDLVLLEVMSMGVPVIATATGGNKSVHKVVPEVTLCDASSSSMAESIMSYYFMSVKERDQIGKRIRNAYLSHFTECCMAERYIDTIRRIYDDYNLWDELEGKV